MLRTYLFSTLALLFFAVCVVQADDKKDKDDNAPTKATITKVDAKGKTVTVKMKTPEGKEVEKTFDLTAEVKFLDSTGKAIAIDIFRTGDDVLLVQKEGKLMELRQAKKEEKKDK
jgi:ABC-type Fe3+-hydroxamate transport system substrate-binding protein